MFKNIYFQIALGLIALLLIYKYFIKEDEAGADENSDESKSILPASITRFDKYAGTRAEGSGVIERVFCPSGQVYDKSCACCKDVSVSSRISKRKALRRAKRNKPRFY